MEDTQGETIEENESVNPADITPTEEEAQSQPDGEKDRTAEQFAKLTEANKRLKEENEKLKGGTATKSVFESLRPEQNFPNVPEQTAQEIADQLFDEQGYLDPGLLNKKLKQAEEIAKQASQAAQTAQQQLRTYEETQKTKELYKEYPQLDPNGDSFDPDFFSRVRNELIGQLMQGKEDPLEAARVVDKAFSQTSNNKAQVQEAKNLKQQASSDLGTSQGASAPVDHDYLVEETRKGNSNALAERLRRIGA